MAEAESLLIALQMGDSAFPSGGFAFSWGLETLKADRMVTDAAGVAAFVRTLLGRRWATAERPVLRGAVGADPARLGALDREVEAMTLAAELRECSRRAGRSLLRAHARLATPGVAGYREAIAEGRALGHLPVAQAVAWTGAGMTADAVEALSAWTLVAALGQAAVRLALIGPLQAQAMLAGLRPEIADLLATPCPERPHAFTPAAEIAAMRHETGEARLFAS